MESHITKKDASVRKRGRPAGSNRVPLSAEQRRERNAQYERERRVETAEAMGELADAAGCVPNTSNAEILATVINYFQQVNARHPTEDIESLRRCNKNLLRQIESLEQRLVVEQGTSTEASPSSAINVDETSRGVQIENFGCEMDLDSSFAIARDNEQRIGVQHEPQLHDAPQMAEYIQPHQQIPLTFETALEPEMEIIKSEVADEFKTWAIDEFIMEYL